MAGIFSFLTFVCFGAMILLRGEASTKIVLGTINELGFSLDSDVPASAEQSGGS
jgi:hypothetical protein